MTVVSSVAPLAAAVFLFLRVLLPRGLRWYRAMRAPPSTSAKALAGGGEGGRSPAAMKEALAGGCRLSLSQVDGDARSHVEANEAFEVRTEWFVGRMLVLVRGLPMREAYEPLFAGKQRILEFQLQGRFPRGAPPGEVFLGARLARPAPAELGRPVRMTMGMMSRALAVAVLRFLRAFVPALHYSFGSFGESAHISAPLFGPAKARAWTVVRTPAGGAPPRLGSPLEKRSETAKHVAIDDTSTYTIAYYTPNLDLPNWALVNLPGLGGRNVDLRYFWAENGLVVEVYALDHGAPSHAETFKNHIVQLAVAPKAHETDVAPVAVAPVETALPVRVPKKPRASVRAFRRLEVAVSRWSRAVSKLKLSAKARRPTFSRAAFRFPRRRARGASRGA